MRWQGLITLLVLAGGVRAGGAQIAPPVIQWQRSFGGSGNEWPGCIRANSNGYILAGTSASAPGGNKLAPTYGSYDYWVLQLNTAGDKVWERSIGGASDDWLFDLELTSDGGCILAGESFSPTNSLKTGILFGCSDFWLVRLDASGDKLWDKTFGGDACEEPFGVQQTRDGGFILAGWSGSLPGGNRTATNFGGNDCWIVRTDSQGSIVWERGFGSSFHDEAYGIRETREGSFVVSGTGNGVEDYWVFGLDGAGNKLWEGTYGGSDIEYRPQVVPTDDGGFFLAGSSRSAPDAGKSALFSGANQIPFGDFWIVRVDPSGRKLWDTSCGGTGDESVFGACLTSDGGLVICGFSTSIASGSKTTPTFGARDGWVVRLDSSGNKLWELLLGGPGDDYIYSVQQTTDGGFILAGASHSGVGGTKTSPNYGGSDLWVIKLGSDALTAPQLRALTQSAESIRAGGFRLELQPPPNAPTNAFYILEGSTNMTRWEAIQTNQINSGASMIGFVDTSATNRPNRFYRARMER